jgi:acetyl esterase
MKSSRGNRSLRFLILLYLICFGSTTHAQRKSLITYKQVDNISLEMEIFLPENAAANSPYPCIVFYFGGGWNGGTVTQFEPHAEYFASRGMVCFLVDYRVKTRQGTTPFESLMDAKSAIRFIRAHADEFHVDQEKIVASGGSAGGHLAAATALIEDFSELNDDLAVSCVPNALILFNPVIDNGPGGYGYERIGSKYKDFSPLHNIDSWAPPTIFFLGTEDNLIPVETAEYYKTVMEKFGSRCDLHIYEGQKHGFFNFKNPEYFHKTVLEADKFLISLGFLIGEPTIKTNP